MPSSTEICGACITYGRCRYEHAKALLIADAKAIADELEPQSNIETLRDIGLRVNGALAQYRNEARANNCPKDLNVDPDYPGKNLI